MCKSLWMFPLIKFKDDKQKLLFNYGVNLKSREEFDYFSNTLLKDFKYSLFSDPKIKSLANIVHEPNYKEFVKFVSVPCGCCSECLKDKSRQWALRIMKEAELYEDNYFITLTYDDEHIPADRNLDKKAISEFNKKLKTYLNRKGFNSNFRFYGVGEYGSITARPHYHVIYFNLPLFDLKFYKCTKQGDILFTSEFLNSIWQKGYVVVGGLSVGSACYVARYCDKKRLLNKKQRLELELKGIVPEFSIMSRMPGIGSYYLDDIIKNVENGCYTISYKNNNWNIPMYYSKKLKEILKDTDVLKEYEKVKKRNQTIKISNDLIMSDIVDDLEVVRELEDRDKLKHKKGRLDL